MISYDLLMASKPVTLQLLLEAAPLYQSALFMSKGLNQEAYVGPPQLITRYCDACDHETSWALGQATEPIDICKYLCRNCSASPRSVVFALRWEVSRTSEGTQSSAGMPGYIQHTAHGKVTKWGQLPAIEERVSSGLAKQLDETHFRYYKQAIRLRNFGLGIAALAYMRRVVEDNVNQLLDIVLEEAKLAGDTTVDIEEIERVKAGKVFEKKIEYAKSKLPSRLLVGGHNPLDKLHSVTSEGIHALTDDECIEVFDAARLVFEYFFENLPEQQRKEREYGRAVSNLSTKSE
jgi:hypothetical protein